VQFLIIGVFEWLTTFLISHNYESQPPINKMKKNKGLKRTKEDENTKLFIFEDDKRWTTADSGGESVLKGLEFQSVSDLENLDGQGELNEFIAIFKLIDKMDSVKSVNIVVGDIPKGKRGKGFSKLNDGITRRKYAAGAIVLADNREVLLLDVEREDKALSILLLYSMINVDWIKIN